MGPKKGQFLLGPLGLNYITAVRQLLHQGRVEREVKEVVEGFGGGEEGTLDGWGERGGMYRFLVALEEIFLLSQKLEGRRGKGAWMGREREGVEDGQ